MPMRPPDRAAALDAHIADLREAIQAIESSDALIADGGVYVKATELCERLRKQLSREQAETARLRAEIERLKGNNTFP